MKKLFLMLLPVLIVIAVFFYFTDRTFNFQVFLDVVSSWNFANSYELLIDIRDEFAHSLDILETGRNHNSMGIVNDGILSLLKNMITLPIASLRVAVSYVLELIGNVGNVLGYLLGW